MKQIEEKVVLDQQVNNMNKLKIMKVLDVQWVLQKCRIMLKNSFLIIIEICLAFKRPFYPLFGRKTSVNLLQGDCCVLRGVTE